MQDLTPQQKRRMVVVTVLFRTCIVDFLCLGFLTYYFGATCPIVANADSGHIHPFYDKVYGRYVYMTEVEQNILLFLFCIGTGCVFACVVIDLTLKRSFARLTRGTD